MPQFKMYLTPLNVYLTLCSLILLGSATYWLRAGESPAAPTASSRMPVVAVEAERRDVPVLVRAVGNVRSLRSIEIRPQVDGLLMELPANEGQLVKRGDLLARIDDRAIVAALDHAKAQQAVAHAQLQSATLDLKRYRTLASIQAVSTQVLDQQVALVDQLQATVRGYKATVSANQVQLTHTRLYSPTDGRVGIRNVHEGSYVRASDSLFSVVQLDPISIESSLPQSRLPELQALMTRPDRSSVLLRAYSSDGGPLLGEGQLELIDNRVSEATGTVRIKGNAANPQGHLWPDQSIVITLQAGTLLNALVVPQRSLRQGVEDTFVWRIRDGKAFPQSVQIKYSDNDIAVVEGIQPGDRIVTDGYSKLRPGIAVDILQTTDATTNASAARSTF
jgi:RND family efflux transporter MFP subunit